MRTVRMPELLRNLREELGSSWQETSAREALSKVYIKASKDTELEAAIPE